jgi:hypothetical protein
MVRWLLREPGELPSGLSCTVNFYLRYIKQGETVMPSEVSNLLKKIALIMIAV